MSDAVDGVMNGEYYQESNGPADSYAAISQVDRLQSEPESIRKWREEQTERLEALAKNCEKAHDAKNKRTSASGFQPSCWLRSQLLVQNASSRKQEAEWKEKAIKELEEWYARQDEQLQKTKANNSSLDSSLTMFWPPSSGDGTLKECLSGSMWRSVGLLSGVQGLFSGVQAGLPVVVASISYMGLLLSLCQSSDRLLQLVEFAHQEQPQNISLLKAALVLVSSFKA
ncbi:hypothetical protein P7K49_001366 [Saguinus oedipus]|uniref:Clathrin light chain n=1 Tax=Saguinus oedipus TaxID=9490 RepID=A0ABQ9WER3_SAGOE|nr:hypothetical protein P7K49_001366 [Saguinus oedipus]